MRKLPTDKNGVEITPPLVKPVLNWRRTSSSKVQLASEIRKYSLITPLFGGGVKKQQADPVTTVRGTEIRGLLRFWWRACKGGQFGGKIQDMKRKEDEIWGSAAKASKPGASSVDIGVKVDKPGSPEHPFRKDGSRTKAAAGWRDLAYAAFPLQDGENNSPDSILSKVSFTLTITFPEEKRQDVEAALWAWETFGGIGARTRRGFGALKNLDAPLPDGDVNEYIQKGLEKYVVDDTWPAGVPHLSWNPRLIITRRFNEPREAWEYLIKKLKTFRQSRNRGKNGPGRSHWPEPDAIRELTNRRSTQHQNRLLSVDKFPRAALGLPIVFKFKDEGTGDPEKTMLRGVEEDYERLASPLILRPLECSGGQGVGLALVLDGTSLPPGGLLLKDLQGQGSWNVDAVLTQAEARQIVPLGQQTDILQAFLNTL